MNIVGRYILCEIKPPASDLESLCKFPFPSTFAVDGLKSELPKYLAASEDVVSQSVINRLMYVLFYGVNNNIKNENNGWHEGEKNKA